MYNTNVVGFCGSLGSGKSTAAGILETVGYNKIAFAKPLKEMLHAVGLNFRQLNGSIEDKNKTFRFVYNDTKPDEYCNKMLTVLGVDCKKSDVKTNLLSGCTPNEASEKLKTCGIFSEGLTTPRILMQLIGTEWARNLNPDFWTNLLMTQIKNRWKNNPGLKFAIEDVRFLNEVKLVKEIGGVNIRLYQEDVDESVSSGLANHASEQTHLLKVDANLYNDKVDYNRLRTSLLSLLEHIG